MTEQKERAITLILTLIGCLSILVNLTIKGFSPENLLDAVKDLVGLLITIAVLIVAYSISNKSKTYLDSGIQALTKLKNKYTDFLLGPEYDKSDYNPEELTKSQRMRYLFFKPNKYGKKVAFIPLEPIEQGIIDIRVSKATLVNFGYDSKDSSMEITIQEAKTKIYKEIDNLLSSKYNGLYEILSNNEESQKMTKYSNSAIVFDFKEEQMKYKTFEKAVFHCAEKALKILLQYKKSIEIE